MKIKLILVVFLYTISINLLSANTQWIENIKYKKNIHINEIFSIDLRQIEYDLKEQNNSNILFEWNMEWENTQIWSIFKKEFKKSWDYTIDLSIYKLYLKNKELITNKKINIFVYDKKITGIFDEYLWEKIDTFIANSKDSWVYIEPILIKTKDIEKIRILEKISGKIDESWYIIIWGNKEFIFDILSKISYEKYEKSLKIVIISPFNINILKTYIWNFISNKSFIENTLLIDESSKYEILKQALDIKLLKKEMSKNNYEYVEINSKEEINPFLFVSKFINNLSNNWFSTVDIYIILIIPFLLVWVIVFKHLIWLSTTWLIIPTLLTLLFIKLSFVPTMIITSTFLFTNLLISKLISKYKLHYSPRIVLVTIINIIIIIITINILIRNNMLSLSINDIMFIIFFIVISEKVMNLIVSKDLFEYRDTIINTIIFSILAYMFFSLGIIKTFILSYPEIIIFLTPIAFVIWRFTGLRVTEYFRFRDVIKSIEE